MHSLPDTEDVARVLGVPAGSRVTEMCLGREEHFKGDFGGFRGVSEEVLWPVDTGHITTETVEFDLCTRGMVSFSIPAATGLTAMLLRY